MHPNPNYRRATKEQDLDFVQHRGFGMIVMNHDDTPLVSHIPFHLTENQTQVEAHLVRSNPIWHAIKKPQKAKLIVQGPDAYVSPDWYGVVDQVPTWNYIAVHFTVTLHRLPQDQLRGILDRLSAKTEARIPSKSRWTIDKMTLEVFDKMQRQIVPIVMDIKDMHSTWKLSQNKPDSVRCAAINGMSENQIGSEVEALLTEMRKV